MSPYYLFKKFLKDAEIANQTVVTSLGLSVYRVTNKGFKLL